MCLWYFFLNGSQRQQTAASSVIHYLCLYHCFLTHSALLITSVTHTRNISHSFIPPVYSLAFLPTEKYSQHITVHPPQFISHKSHVCSESFDRTSSTKVIKLNRRCDFLWYRLQERFLGLLSGPTDLIHEAGVQATDVGSHDSVWLSSYR